MTMETNAFDYESLTVAELPVGFDSSKTNLTKMTRATKAVATLETGQIRYRVDGTDPTSNEGSLWGVGEIKEFSGIGNLDKFRAIRTGGVSGVLKVTFEH